MAAAIWCSPWGGGLILGAQGPNGEQGTGQGAQGPSGEQGTHTHTDWTRLEWIGPHFFAILVVEIGLRS